MQNKKLRHSFKLEWLKVKVIADTPDFKNMDVKLSLIYEYSDANGLKHTICSVYDLNARFPDNKQKLWSAFDPSALKLSLTFYCLNKLKNFNLQ